jgi:3-dehydroquinate synthase
VQKIWQGLLDAECDRKSLLIAVGGGVIGDMAGFAATTYMRGIDFVHVPTTLLAQVDSSVGGKTAIDFAGVKNLVGSFGQPVCTLIDVETLQTLPEREFVSGFGELIKHGLIRDKQFLDLVTGKKPRDFSPDELAEIITWSCRIKAAVVMEDERETGPRKALNFGHTVGHAVEALSLEGSSPLLHGEAVSIGMVVEAELAHAEGLLTSAEHDKVARLLAGAGLPTHIPADQDIPELLSKMRSDKKNVGGSIRFTLLERLGSAVWGKPVDEIIITSALETLRSRS